ncbi:MAG: sel1 repeat family protein, partial [Gammaproteobacteria bacterium]|nr:sel1 repeat family protein [Gammaproteobacteria bacterium]
VMKQVVNNGQISRELQFQLSGIRDQFDEQHKAIFGQDYLIKRQTIYDYLRSQNETDGQLVHRINKYFTRLYTHGSKEIIQPILVPYFESGNSIPERLLEDTHASFNWLANFAHQFFQEQNLVRPVPHILHWKRAIDDLVDFLYLTPVFEHNKTQEAHLKEILGDAKGMLHHVIRIKTSKEFFTYLFQQYTMSVHNLGNIVFQFVLKDLFPEIPATQKRDLLLAYQNILNVRHELHVASFGQLEFNQVQALLQESSQALFKEMAMVLAPYFYGADKEKALRTTFQNKLKDVAVNNALDEVEKRHKLILGFIGLGFSTDADLNRKAREQLWKKSDFLEFFQQHPLDNQDFFLIHLPKLLSQFFSVEESVLAAVNLAEDAQANRDDEDLLTCGYSEIDQTVEKLVNCLAYVRARFPVGASENTVVHKLVERKQPQQSVLAESPYDPLPSEKATPASEMSGQSGSSEQETTEQSSSTPNMKEDLDKKRQELTRSKKLHAELKKPYAELEKNHAYFFTGLESVFGERLQKERMVIQDGLTYGQMVQAHKHGIPIGHSFVYWRAIKRGISFQLLRFMSPEAIAVRIFDIDQTKIELPTVTQIEGQPSELVLSGDIPEHGEFSFEDAVGSRHYNDPYYGFAAFGLSAEKVFRQLLKNAEDLSLRQLMQKDVVELVRAKVCLQVDMPFEGYQALRQQHQKIQKIKDAFIRELVDAYGWEGDLDSLIALDDYETAVPLPVNKKQKEFINCVEAFKTTVLLPELLKERELLLAFCLRKDVFKHYIKILKRRPDWYSSCFTNMPPILFQAIAKLNQISVYYWELDPADATRLKFVHMDDQKSPRMVHLLHDPNQKRLIPLVIKSRPAPQKAYVDETYYIKRIEELRALAESGDAKAQAVLGKFLAFGCGVERDYESAVFWLSAACRQNDSDGYISLGDLYLYRQSDQRNPERAVELFNQAVLLGNMQAVCHLGEAYLQGWRVKQNRKKAFQLFEIAAKKHIAEALVNLALCYRNGFGVAKNFVVARYLFEVVLRDYKLIPFNQAMPIAKLHLADMYSKSEGGEENLELAKRYVADLLESNIPVVVCQLGAWYYSGFMHSGDADDQKAFELYQRTLALDPAYGLAHFNLGICYFEGRGTQQNYSLAYKHFKKALRGGCSSAASFLGKMAYAGLGMAIDYEKAFHLCSFASKLPNNQEALFYLGLMHFFGLGTEVNQDVAQTYFEQPIL